MKSRLSRWVDPKGGLLQLVNIVVQAFQYIVTATWYRLLLGYVGSQACIMGARFYGRGRSIRVGKGASIRYGTRIEAVGRFAGQEFSPELSIGDYTSIEQNCHIVCAERIRIGKNVTITAGSSIVDIVHPFYTTEEKIGSAPISTAPVEIGDGAFLGVNTVVLPGTRWGRES